MSMFMDRDDLIVAGVALLVEKTNIRKDLALASAQDLAAKIPTAPGWRDSGQDKVLASAETPFLSALLDKWVHRRAGWNDDVPDAVISFADPEPTLAEQLKPLDDLLGKLKAQDAVAHTQGTMEELLARATALRASIFSDIQKMTAPPPVAKAAPRASIAARIIAKSGS